MNLLVYIFKEHLRYSLLRIVLENELKVSSILAMCWVCVVQISSVTSLSLSSLREANCVMEFG